MFTIHLYRTGTGRSPVHEFILAQEPKAQDKVYEVLDYLKTYGFHLSTKYLRRLSGSGRLWEIRAKSHSKQYRLLLSRLETNVIVILHAFVKKTAKTPRQDIETAEERLRLYEKGGL